ncbi:aldo/keto reductase [Glacieibacterium frigidum]|uniref:Aldo/keto reductase n=1 Tax=Glacieibacterium frigidum TaxID=2593303 RepID=A0A552UFL8_9SPHN|nr:aldo/keto reductase [Glacieibacterium frigidum]TRW17010.1 aldo/keto reductase [Glacieibacterium frigidum]
MTEITLSPEPRPLGKSGLSVSPMAWGMWRFGGDDVRAAREKVEAAFDAGITLFDTADIYGPDNDEPFGASELLLGRVFAEAPGLRDRMVLASKGGIRMGVPYDSSPAYLREAVEASLTRLGVERIDLWQVHRPDMLAHPAEVAATLDALVTEGKIGAVGVSNHTPAQTAALAAHLTSGLASTQPEFSCLATAPLFDGTLDLAMQAGTAVLAWSPLGQGRLAEGDPRPGRGKPDDAQATRVKAALDAHAAKYGVDRTAVAYAWVMAHPARPIPIVGTQTPARIAASADAYKVSFTRAEWYAILVASLGEDLP